jgi:hypothetical protein
MRPTETILGMGRSRLIKRVNSAYGIRTFVNVTMHSQYNNNMKIKMQKYK